MITLTVASFNGAPLTQPLTAQFDEMGGNIGRAENNQLVLPDPERTISRVHAQVVFRSGRYAIVDRGSNPISVNGRPLGNGQEAPLQPGDQVQIGGYALKVEAGASAAVDLDPFADFGGLAAPAAPSRAAPPSHGASADPLAGFGMAPAPASGGAFGAPASAPRAAGGIPEDWDPFAPDPVAPGPADPFARTGQARDLGLEVGGRGAGPLIPDTPGGSAPAADSLDNLFGLGAGRSDPAADPFANSVMQSAAAQPNMAAHADPMRSLNSLTQASASAAPDQLSELNAPFELPPMSAPAARAAPTPPPAAAPVATPSAPKGAVLSWGEPSAESRTIIRKAGGAGAAPVSAPAPAAPVAPAAAWPAPAAPTARSGATPDTQALIDALRQGLGVPALPIDTLTPEFMRLVGQLLNDATRGTVELLVARAALKREVRAEVTMIVARENNPLKFSPSAEVALNHLLSPPVRGFMPADRAMRDAYDDLRAHQFGFLAGMRAALEGVLQRFDPAQLEGKLTQKKSMLGGLLPATRKARMWDVFQELYQQISEEAADDFHELFGKEFLRAYEAHIEQLKKDQP